MIKLPTSCRRWRSTLWTGAAVVTVGVTVACGARNGTATETHAATGGASAQSSAQLPIELFRERYPNGKVKIEREVTIDADGNYVNHGAWRSWKESNTLEAEGSYDMGRRSGLWTRFIDRNESPLLSEHPLKLFEAPFVSRATFAAGELDGEWIIVDAKDRRCSRVGFVDGKRDGTATLWQPDGKVFREATFRNGLAVGDVRERDASGRLATVATYIDGHQLVNKTTCFPGTDKKKCEASYLTSVAVETSPDDFWQLRFAEYAAHGEERRHGEWRLWYVNGQITLEGSYQFGRENGAFTWWHANGQTAVEGEFIDGQADGTWVWWHANGQKATQGSYHYGTLIGTWRGWNEDGRVVQRDEHGNGVAGGQLQQATRLTEPTPAMAEIAR